MNEENKTKIWNVIFSILFLVILVITINNFETQNLLNEIQLFEFIILVLATFRLIRLFVYDKVMKWLRDIFEIKEKTGLFATIKSLLGCPWCFGIWATLIVFIINFLVPKGEIFILILAISSIGSLIQISANLIGWSAEKKKIEVQKLNK